MVTEKPLLIGLTGGIGSGKSFVATLIEQCGYPVYDCDSRAKALMLLNTDLRCRIIELFGVDAYLDDDLNRPFLAKCIFNDSTLLSKMNALVHPAVLSDFLQWSSFCKTKFVFCESAIIYESGLNQVLDSIVCVDAPKSIRIERVLERDATTPEQVERRMAAQMQLMEHRNDFAAIIINDGQRALLPQLWKMFDLLSVKY